MAPAFDIVALVTSAGGLDALSRVLSDLPPDLPAPVLVMQHLSGQGSSLVTILTRRLSIPVRWIEDGDRLERGVVHICRARRQVETLPDGSVSVNPLMLEVRDRPIDALLTSLARSYGTRALAVVLTGMGRDGGEGTRALKAAGGTVITQSEDTAEHPSMPRAAREAGADAVLPLHEIGAVIDALLRGQPLPHSDEEREAIRTTFGTTGTVASIARDMDWTHSAFGPVHRWPPVLRAVTRLIMDSPEPAAILWGPEQLLLMNDASLDTLRRPPVKVIARSYLEAYPEIALDARAVYGGVLRGESHRQERRLIRLQRNGLPEDAWFDVVYEPIREADGVPVGILTTWRDRTDEVLASRRLQVLNALAVIPVAHNRRDALEACVAVLDEAEDVPFAAAYFFDPVLKSATLVCVAGADAGSAVAPRTAGPIGAGWPLQRVVSEGPVVIDDVAQRFRGSLLGSEQYICETAVLHPLHDKVKDQVIGALVFAASPRVPLDEPFRAFLAAAAETINAKVAESHATHRERERLEQLAGLDRAKTEFFSNISHEFRTPLTLMLAPLDELQRRRSELPHPLGAEIAVAASNARRLLALVDTLLDFSQIEDGRLRPRFEPTDLAALTADIASVFRAAMERAGLTYRIDCPPLSEPVWVDREMWQKVVSNLLSNALKFTLQGTIAVELRQQRKHAELTVRDTGVGIPRAERPHIFKRFHRVVQRRARTHEGAGIGLALVSELITRHHGLVRVDSEEDVGTTFKIWVPLGSRVEDPAAVERPSEATSDVAIGLAEQACSWLAEPPPPPPPPPADIIDDVVRAAPPVRIPGARIVVAEDNADLRDYLRRLLSAHWEVLTAADGEEALRLTNEHQPELVLADVMMPNVDGFELLRRIRAGDAQRRTPVMLVTAHVGEERAIDGLLAGADDYIAKPFSPRELLARASALIELARMRRRTEARQVYLLTLSDALQPLFDPLDIQQTASRVLGEALGVSRVAYSEADLGEAVMDARVRDESIVVPLVRAGKVVATLGVHSPGPRQWSAEEVEMVRETADRTWSAVTRARAELALQTEAAALSRLHEASTRLWRTTDLKSGLMEMLDASIALVGADMGNVQLINPATGMLEIAVQRGFGPAFLECFREVSTAHDCACGRSLRTGDRIAIEDVERDAEYAPYRTIAAASGFRAVQSSPLLGRDGIALGMLSTHFRQPALPSELQFRRLDLYLRQAADFIERHRAGMGLAQLSRELS